MKNTPIIKLVTILLLLTILLMDVSSLLPSGSVSTVEASLPNVNVVTGLFRTLSAIKKRNQVYGEARATSSEINAYYDAQIATAQRLRQEKISQAAAGGDNPAFIRSYIRVSAYLDEERRAMIEMVEGEKNDARRKFNRALANEIRRILLASPGGQSIISDIRNTIANTRRAAVAVQSAVSGGKPSNILANLLNDKVGDIQIVRNLAQDLGSKVGSQIDRALGGLITKIESALSDVEGGLGEAVNLLDNFDAVIAQQQNQTRAPVSLVGNNRGDGVIPVDQGNAGVHIASIAFGIAGDRAGHLRPGETRQTMINRIRETLQESVLTGMMTSLLGAQEGEIYCLVTSRGVYEQACASLGTAIQEASNPEQARYLVCFDTQTNEPKLARLLESKFTQETEDEVEEEDLAFASCFLGTESISWGYESVRRNDCTDPARCTGCLGTFVLENTSDRTVILKYYYFNNFSTPGQDGWIPQAVVIEPGQRWEHEVGLENRWKTGMTYKKYVLKVVIYLNSSDCNLNYSEKQLEIFAIPIEPMPCE